VRDYGRVYASFWTSESTKSFSDDGRMLALYLLSGPHSTIAGVCRLPDGYVSEDLGWSSQRVSKGFAELLAKGFANRCETTKWVWIRKFLDWNKPENPNQWKAATKIAGHVPSKCAWRAEFLGVFSKASGIELNPSETVDEGLPEPLPTQEQDQEQKQNTQRRPSKRVPENFSPDLAYASSQIPDIDAEAEAQKFRDWEFAKPRSDWPAVWRTWIRNCKDRGQYARKEQTKWM
jgi:hypothetical protein